MGAKKLPTQAELQKLFDYDADTGLLLNRVFRNPRAPVGSVAGTTTKDRNGYAYRNIQINGQKYKLHRVIWKLVHGVDPEHHIDHLNGNTLDNRLTNLRCATHQENLLNCHFHRSAAA